MMRSVRRAMGSFDQKLRDVRFGAAPRRVALLCLICSIVLLTGGCATISPRNVLPQANANQIDLEGFHNIRFWGDASAPAIETIVMAVAPKSHTSLSPASNLLAISGGAEDGAFGAGLLEHIPAGSNRGDSQR
jgi:hypothetical protein